MTKTLSDCYSIPDLRRAAKRRLPKAVFDYMDGAAEDEVTMFRNQADFGQYELIPRYLVDVKDVDLSTTVLGSAIKVPFVLAPTAQALCAICRDTDTRGATYNH